MKEQKIFLFLIAAVVFIGCGTKYKSKNDLLILADFDKEQNADVFYCKYGVWDKDPGDETQFCNMSCSSEIRSKMKGKSLKIEYDVDSPNQAYNGFFIKLLGENIGKYKKLVFFIKGEAERYPAEINIELKNYNEEVGKYTLKNIESSWRRVDIPLEEFKGIEDLSEIKEFVIVFKDETTIPKTGIIYIDDIYLTNVE
ncbi:MAG: hypothetical protein JW983_09355 [Elusimicrobia bacterium]|nr:hypothetical protein [Elusimicrobiota bacterium]